MLPVVTRLLPDVKSVLPFFTRVLRVVMRVLTVVTRVMPGVSRLLPVVTRMLHDVTVLHVARWGVTCCFQGDKKAMFSRTSGFQLLSCCQSPWIRVTFS